MNTREHAKTAYSRRSNAFTLVELVVVLGIISVLAVISLPNINRMVTDTRRADAENRLQGLLRSARMRALHRQEGGLFFYIEGDAQKIAFIQAEPLNLIKPVDEDTAPDWGDDGALHGGDDVVEKDTVDRFRVLTDTVYELPPPFRAVPRNIPFDEDGADFTWDDDELANNDHRKRPTNGSPGIENHRNFFTIIFSPDGTIQVGRPVLIHDHSINSDFGGITGLPVAFAEDYQDVTTLSFKSFKPGHPLPKMVVNESDDKALTFPSVDGVLVYDDALFRDHADDDVVTMRQFLIRHSRPLYISRQTGAIVRGPRGEDES